MSDKYYSPYTFDHFIEHFNMLPDTQGNVLKALSDAEELALITMTGTHLTAILEGQLDYFQHGATPKARILWWLEIQKNWPPYNKTLA